MKTLFLTLGLLLITCAGQSQSLEKDSVLVIREPEEFYPMNPLAYLFKDTGGEQKISTVKTADSLFSPLHGSMHQFYGDDHIAAYWLRCRIKNETRVPGRYVMYFHPGFDSIESFVFHPDGTVEEQSIISSEPASKRPVYISQETVFPMVLQPGLTTIYFRIANHSIFSQQLNSIIVNLAEERNFLNYFLQIRYYQGIVLGMICVMLVFHIFIYFFFRDTTYLIFVINMFITLIYLLLRKNYQEEIAWLSPLLPVLRYAHDPSAMVLCMTVIWFSQSFLNTKNADSAMHRIMNYLQVALGAVTLCMICLFALHWMDFASIYLGFLTAVLVLVAAIRSYLAGNNLALYAFFGFSVFLIVPFIYLIPLPGYLHYRNSESDMHYLAEAVRSVIFAVGIADRFYGIKKEAVRKEIEQRKTEFEKEKQMQDEKERISRDLHDNIGSQLTSLAQGLNRLAKHQTFQPEKLTELFGHANAAMMELRETIWVINKSEVTLEELNDKINNLFWRLRQQDDRINFELQTEVHTPIQKLAPAQAISLFRIVQESVNNSQKHSGAKVISVSLKLDNNILSVTIGDNGCGFDATSSHVQDHYGIQNMRKRAAEIQGKFELVSGQQGTTISVAVPV